MSIPSRGCQLTHRQRVYSFHQISMRCTNTTKYTVQVLDRNPSEKCSELIHFLQSALQVCYDIRASKIVHVQQMRVLDNGVLACKFDVQDPSPCLPPACLPHANFCTRSIRAGRQQSISPQSTLMTLCSSDAAFRTKNKIAMCTSDVK